MGRRLTGRILVAILAALAAAFEGGTLSLNAASGFGTLEVVTNSAQATGLKIVVIAGEDAVNIVQQRSAVAPIVEVRDQNGLPVSGATVTFTVQSGPMASFAGGTRTLTVTTNTAGRAVAANLRPLTSGNVQIQAAARYQGQTATATINQVNFATAAQAAAAGAATGATAGATAAAGAATGTTAGTTAAVAVGGAAAAGGLSALAITGIAAGAGGGALIAAKAAGVIGGGNNPLCVVTVSPTSFSAPSQGATFAVRVDLQPDNCEPQSWTLTSDQFLSFVGNSPGSITLQMSVMPNSSGSPARTGTAGVAGKTVTVTQSAACLFSVSPASVVFPRSGGSVALAVVPTPGGCDTPAWTATTISTGIALSPAAGSGSGTVTATAAPIVLLPNSPVIPYTGNLNIAGVIVPFVQ